jgi:NAD(P)-dependent dehydrogenase (short-subunit alcohol dehydrogenase family)
MPRNPSAFFLFLRGPSRNILPSAQTTAAMIKNAVGRPRYAIVTGCSITSIGFLAAQKLCKTHRVILACRRDAAGTQALEAMPKDHDGGHLHYPAVYCQLDLASFASIRSFADHVLHKVDDGAIGRDGLDCLVCNAGVAWGGNSDAYQTTEDGLEEIVGVNHVGHFLLTNLLLDALQKAKGARVVVVSSSLHDTGPDKPLLPDFPNGIFVPAPEQKNATNAVFDGKHAYRVSKLCNIWFAYELHRRYELVANAISPGFIPLTGLFRHAPAPVQFFLRYMLDPLRYVGIGPTASPEHGAETIVQAVLNDVKGGEYFRLEEGKIKAMRSSVESYDQAKASQLWDMTMEICHLK